MKKERLFEHIDANREEIIALGDKLFATPELGFKEVKTGQIIEEYLQKHGLKVSLRFSHTGFAVTLGDGSPHIGLIAELDAIPTLGHPCADPVTTAAHACGHSTQCTIMLAALDAIKTEMPDFNGRITLFFTPAEEFTDIPFRQQLVKEGKVRYFSGKQNMIADHLIDDVDLFIHLHAMGDPDHHFSLGSSLAGFTYKKYTFLGRSSHAAVLPHLGINALNECNLFLTAVAMLRETFREEDLVRIHGIIAEGGNTVNSIPDKVVYESYVRSNNPAFLLELSHKLTETAIHCAKAIGGDCQVEDIPGYLPLNQDEELNKTVLENLLKFAPMEDILFGEKSVAGGDVGDICVFKPVVQFGYNGFAGRIHGDDMKIVDKDEVYITQAKVVCGIVYDLLTEPERIAKVKEKFTPKMTYDEYIAHLNQ